MLAKLACGINKPNKQTILPNSSVSDYFKTIDLKKIRNLGGKLGVQLKEKYSITNIGELTKIPISDLIISYGDKTGRWLYDVCRGGDDEPVKERHIAQSVGCSKNFRGPTALDTRGKVKQWMECLAQELVDRLSKDKQMNSRTAKDITVHLGFNNKRPVSRVCHIDKYEIQHIVQTCYSVISPLNENNQRNTSDAWVPAITMMGMYAKNFHQTRVSGNSTTGSISSLLANSCNRKAPTQQLSSKPVPTIHFNNNKSPVKVSTINESLPHPSSNFRTTPVEAMKKKKTSLDNFFSRSDLKDRPVISPFVKQVISPLVRSNEDQQKRNNKDPVGGQKNGKVLRKSLDSFFMAKGHSTSSSSRHSPLPPQQTFPSPASVRKRSHSYERRSLMNDLQRPPENKRSKIDDDESCVVLLDDEGDTHQQQRTSNLPSWSRKPEATTQQQQSTQQRGFFGSLQSSLLRHNGSSFPTQSSNNAPSAAARCQIDLIGSRSTGNQFPANPSKLSTKLSSKIPNNTQERKMKASIYSSYGDDMKNIDMDIFNSLPPEIQNELNSHRKRQQSGSVTNLPPLGGAPSSSNSSSSSSKQLPPSPGKQKSITSFLQPMNTSPVLCSRIPSSSDKKRSKKSRKHQHTSPKKAAAAASRKENAGSSINFRSGITDTKTPLLPLGFFSARARACASIKTSIMSSRNKNA